jgi:hypothetical protein
LVVTTFAEYGGGLCAKPEWTERDSVCAISDSERDSVCAVSGANSCALLGPGSWIEVPVGQKAHNRRGRPKVLFPAIGRATDYLSDHSLGDRVPGADRDRRDRLERLMAGEELAAGEPLHQSWQTRISYRMECRRCGLCAEARADAFNEVLSRIAEAGREELSLRALVSILANYRGHM